MCSGPIAVHRPQFVSWVLLVTALAATCCTSNNDQANGGDAGKSCAPNDQDGIIGGDAKFLLTVNDQGFTPLVIAAENAANVTLELVNAGTKSHDFVIDCIPNPNTVGCPQTSCFPEQADIEPLPPGATAETSFVTPLIEGIYYFHSDEPGDTDGPCAIDTRGCGQFVVNESDPRLRRVGRCARGLRRHLSGPDCTRRYRRR